MSEGVVPSVGYRSLLANLGVELRAGWFVVELDGGGRFLLDSGEIASSAWFPSASGFGLDARAQLGVGLGDWLDLRLSGAGELYRLNFGVSSAAASPDAFPNGVAAGASDHYLQALFSLRFRLSKAWPAW